MPIVKVDSNGTHLNIILGDGDLIIGQVTQQDTKKVGLSFYENPNNEIRPCGEKQHMPELVGETVSCLCEFSASLFFKNISDIDLLIKDLQLLKEAL